MPRSVKSIYDEILQLPISDDIKEAANRIFQDMYICTRQQKRRMIIFACLFYAYKQLQRTIDPYDLAQMMGIEKNNLSKALKYCSEYETGFRPSSYVFTIHDFLQYYLERLGNISGDEIIYKFADEIIRIEPALNDIKPQYVAICLLHVFFELYSIDSTKKQMKELTDRCPATTFKRYTDWIKNIYIG